MVFKIPCNIAILPKVPKVPGVPGEEETLSFLIFSSYHNSMDYSWFLSLVFYLPYSIFNVSII